MPLLHDPLTLTRAWAQGALIAAAIGLTAYRARALTRSGVIAAVIIGAFAFAFGGLLVALAIVIFFAAGSGLSRIPSPAADRERHRAVKDAERDGWQVLANGGIATACAVAGGIATVHGSPHAARFMIAAVCAIAAASGDTWSTEIGALSGSLPRRITDLQPVAAGTSGGATLLGVLAAPLGGAVIGLAGLAGRSIAPLALWLLAGALAGLGGSLFDSVLGATLQGVWRCPRCGQLIEAPRHLPCEQAGDRVKGLRWLNNDGVNALATLGGALFGYLAAGLLA